MSKLYRSLLWSGLIVAGVAACGDDVTVTPPAPPPPPPSTPATISIRSITTGNLNTPVLLNNVQGQIDVTLNLDAGTQTVSNVQVLIDGAVACQQGFSAISAAAANQTELDVIPVVCSINTAAFNPTTGVATYLNGARLLTAKVNLVGSAPVATPSTTLIFNNTSIIAITASVTGTSANSASGILWQTGDLVATALPVIYTAGSPAIQQIVLTPTGGLSSKTLTAAPYTATWAKATSVASGGAGSKSGGIELAGLVVNGASTVGGAVGPNGTSNAINFDTKGPPAPTFVANPNSRQNGWINATVGLAAVNGTSTFAGTPSATDNDWLVNPASCAAGDCGVGGYVRTLRIADGTAGTVDLAIAAAGSATPTLPARTLNPTDQCAVATAADLLGNETSLPAAGSTCLSPPAASFVNTGSQSLRFGVDLDAPTIAFSGGLAALGSTAGRILAATVGTEFQVTVADAGAIGVSGMLGGAPVIGTVVIFNALGTTCFVGTTGACVPAGTAASFTAAFPLVATNTVAASVTDGYYTGSFIAQDAAGNQSAAITRSIVHEVAGNPGAMGSASPTALPLTGSTVTFNALGSDNLDLRDVQYTLTYGGGLANPIQFPLVAINATPPVPATLKNANVSVGITINGFMRQVENVTSLPAGPLTVGGQFKPTSLDGTLRDQVQASAPVPTGILAGQVTTGVSYLTAPAAQLIRSWTISNAATLVSDGATAPVNPTSVTLVADAFGPTATFSAPFTRVDFYADFGGFLVQIGQGTPDITFDDGSAFGRRQRWTFSWTPGTNFAPGVINLYAIGVNASGDALVSPTNANITITTP